MRYIYPQKAVEVTFGPLDWTAFCAEPAALFIVDSQVFTLYPQLQALAKNSRLVLVASEANKSLATVERILDRLAELALPKDGAIIAVGGGVICDLAGFAAAIYKRGLRLTLVPTTLLAQVDAAIGGKNGVNFSGRKNQLGTIYQPDRILIDPAFLATLPARELQSGLGEIAKYGALFNPELFRRLYHWDELDLAQVVRQCAELKLAITQADPDDLGQRKLLNFGHTAGHLLEVKYGLPHGIAVGYGMVIESGNSEIKNLLTALGWDFSRRFELDFLATQDKKLSQAGTITVIRLRELGKPYLEEVKLTDDLF